MEAKTPVQAIDLLQTNLLTPVVLAFALGAVARLLGSDLKFPESLYTGLSIYLLFAIGLKGGHELAVAGLAAIWKPALATLLLGAVVPLLSYTVARKVLRLTSADAAALAAHYGSVSAVTFAAVLAYCDALRISYEGFMPALVTLLEVPAIVVAIVIARLADRRESAGTGWGALFKEVLTGRSVVLLAGGLLVGRFCTAAAFERSQPLFGSLFYGVLVLFMLDMGTVAASRLSEIGRSGWALAGFAIAMPLVNGATGLALGYAAGLGVGGNAVLAVMSASASYIAAPAAVRIALPEASPGIYLTASIGITFPFNLAVGIPVLVALTRYVHGG